MPKETCILLAGGLGTRLRSVVADVPKCLAPVGKRSFLELQVEHLLNAGIDEIILALGYKADLVIQTIANWPTNGKLSYVVEDAPLGTGGAIALAMDSFGLGEGLVANADTFLDGDLDAMVAPLNRGEGEALRVAAVEVSDTSRFGRLLLDNRGRITGFSEKGIEGKGLVNAGLYRLDRHILKPSGSGAYSLEADIIPGLVASASVSTTMIGGMFIDIGIPSDYHRFCEFHG